MRNEQLLILLLDLPGGDHVFDKVWEKSALAAAFGLFALLGFAAAYFLYRELKAERKAHREECATKDAALAAVNKLFQEQMPGMITTTQALVNKHQEANALTVEMREELQDLSTSLRNGLRALGNALNVPSERMNMD